MSALLTTVFCTVTKEKDSSKKIQPSKFYKARSETYATCTHHLPLFCVVDFSQPFGIMHLQLLG